LCHWNFSLN